MIPPVFLLAAAVLLVGVVAVLLLRRARTAPPGPRTVAELVELRSGSAGAVPPATGAPPPAPRPEPADEVAPISDPVPAPAAVEPDPVDEPVVEPVARLGDDVPWRRGALMNGADVRPPERPAAPRPPATERRSEPTAVRALETVLAPPPPPVAPPAAPVAPATEVAPAAVEEEPPAEDVPPTGDLHGAERGPEGDPDRPSDVVTDVLPETVADGPGSAESVLPPAPTLLDAAGPVAPAPLRGRAVPPVTDLPRPTAEQAAADVALLRTFGAVDLAARPDRAPDVALTRAARPAAALRAGVGQPGAPQPVRFRIVRRTGEPIAGAAVALVDADGRETTAARGGVGELTAPGPGSYLLVATAEGHQAGALALGIADAPVDAELLLVRSAVLRGTVTGEDGPVPGARVVLVQDGEIVEAEASAGDGGYQIDGLAAGEYAVSIAAAGCEPDVALVAVPDEAEIVHDVELTPAGVPAGWAEE